MKWIIYLFLLVGPLSIFSQAKYDYNWMLGYDGNLTGGDGGEGTLIRFGETDGVVVEFVEKDLEMLGSNITMNDSNGNLTFYSNGCSFHTNEHKLMDNGDNINPGTSHNTWCDLGYPIRQSMLCIPDLEHDSCYHVFHIAYTGTSNADYLYSSYIDMSSNDGQGQVVEKNVPIIEDSLWIGYLSGVRHANDEDWWVIAPGYEVGEFHRVKVSSSGVEVMERQDLGLGYDIGGWGAGQSVFSPDGTRYAHFSNREPQLLLYDFNRESGLFSNPQEFFVHDTVSFGGVAFSSDGRFLYVCTATKLFQYDLGSPDIQASQTLVDEYDGFLSPFATNFQVMQLAPDCRIYINTGNGTDRLHIINYPNRKGVDCSFQQHAVKLPSYNHHTLPNFPNYRLGTGLPVCDSTIQLVVNSVEVDWEREETKVYPNPASGQVTIELPYVLPKPMEWLLYDGLGRTVLSAELPKGQLVHTFSLEGLTPGLYFWEVRNEGERLESGKLILK